MNTPILSDIKVLDNLLALNLNVSLWSARKKMVLEDFGGAELPRKTLPRWVPNGLPIRTASRCSPL